MTNHPGGGRYMGLIDNVANLLDPPPTHLCRACGARVRPQIGSKLNGCFLVVLLLFFIVPGILYLVWAGMQKVSTCPKCKAQNNLIPLDSPEARRHLGSVEAAAAGSGASSTRTERACPWCAEQILIAAKICKHCGREVAQ